MSTVWAIFVIIGGAAPAEASGRVSPVLRIIAIPAQQVAVKAGNISWLPIPLKAPGRIEVDVNVLNRSFDDLSVFVCDQQSLYLLQQRRSNGCRGISRGRDAFKFDYDALTPSNYYLVLDNSFSMMLIKKAYVEVAITIRPSPADMAPLQKIVGGFAEEAQSRFTVDAFDVALTPCGQQNAYSMRDGGHIVMCSEMFFELVRRNLRGAAAAILFHELGHTLLNLWGLPNFDNEEAADEFALVMLLWEGRQEVALDWIKFYDGRDPAAEANAIIQVGDRHPLSIQRIRNIERILARPEPVVDRWNKLLYPYLTQAYLRRIIDNPGRFHDRELAQATLSGRLATR